MDEKSYTCSLDPETSSTLHIYLYRDVKNMKHLRKKIVSGDLKCCILKPNLIMDPFQIAVAANKAVVSSLSKTMITRSVYSEILMNLSTSKNITQSLTKFGIDDKCSEILVVIIEQNNESVAKDELLKQIEGIACPISDLSKYTNEKEIESTYMDNVNAVSDKLGYIVSKIACKNFIDRT